MPVHFAQLTDTHVVTRDTDEVLYVDNNGRVAEAVAMLNREAMPVSAVLATGDMTQWGTADEFEVLAELLAPLTMPVLPIPGNHDDRERMRDCFPNHPWADAEHLSWTVTIDGVRIIGLDSTLPGIPGAAFDSGRERWLSDALAAPHEGPTILAMHHPPFVTGIEWMDDGGFVGLSRFETVVRESGSIDRIVCGHMHRQMSAVVGGVLAEVGPATAVHVALDLDLEPGAQKRVIRDAPGYRVFRVDGANIVGHVRFIATGEEPFRPQWAIEEEAAKRAAGLLA